ncbi:MAG: DNA-3-methyladenine glycosylase 2 family protein [Lachnospiraceae bacterium]|nr:DNA-3-methyladenine glycosylase 2 family protein [Lachnospiraceae bacterium]
MKIRFEDDLDLLKIAESGQCFRWKRIDNGGGPAACRVIAGGRVLFVMEGADQGTFELSCTEDEYRQFWSKYLDMDTDYRGIRKMALDSGDRVLSNAADAGKGIRILKQDTFEMLISFIISQRKSIPAIRSTIEKICSKAGKKLELNENEKEWLEDRGFPSETGEDMYAFPSAQDIKRLSPDDLASCGTGYRAPYIEKAAEGIISGEIDLDSMEKLSDEELITELMKIYGVGKKVASCVCLFGFHRLDFFPVDVWIERVLSKYYPDGFPFKTYAPYNGVMQQYLFFNERNL